MNLRILALPVLLLVVSACGDDDASTTTTNAATTAVTAVTTIVPDRLIEVGVTAAGVALVVDGVEIEAGVRVEVARGDLVRIVTSGDLAEEVHVHGYDIAIDVTPAQDQTVEFAADIPGIFEVELEGAGTLVFELVVS